MPPKKKIAVSPTKERSYVIHVEIQDVIEPKVTRTLSVPPSTTFHNLHLAIQTAFGWQNQHSHHFEVINVPAIWLDSKKEPPRVPGPRVLLTIRGPGYYEDDDDDDTPFVDEKTTKLSDVFEQEKYHNKYLEYLYDFGDNWEHSVMLVGRAEEPLSANYIFCIAGEGGPVAENCVGVDGWEGV